MSNERKLTPACLQPVLCDRSRCDFVKRLFFHLLSKLNVRVGRSNPFKSEDRNQASSMPKFAEVGLDMWFAHALKKTSILAMLGRLTKLFSRQMRFLFIALVMLQRTGRRHGATGYPLESSYCAPAPSRALVNSCPSIRSLLAAFTTRKTTTALTNRANFGIRGALVLMSRIVVPVTSDTSHDL